MNLIPLLSRLSPALARSVQQRLEPQPAVEILRVERPALPDTLLGAKLDVRPAKLDEYNVAIAGWALGRAAPVREIRVYSEYLLAASGALDIKRANIAAKCPDVTWAGDSGFLLRVNTLGLRPQFELAVKAVLDDGSEALLGVVHCRQQPLNIGFRPTLNPILVTFFGRTGSTWLMRMLLEHPRILVYPRYPYEVRPMRYWLHVLRVLSAPADHRHSTRPTGFMKDEHWVGHNPFYLPYVMADAEFRRFLGKEHTEHLARFCFENIERFYQHTARLQGRGSPVYFAEKIHPDVAAGLARQVYSNPRELILVRDPRDIFASVVSFNAKRGKTGFRYNEYDNPADYLAFLSERMALQYRLYRDNPSSTYLLRYEELILRPAETLASVLAYLGLDAAPGMVAGILERAKQDTAQMQRHRTTDSPAQSIERWKRDLTPELQDTARAALGDVLQNLGYPV